MCGTIPQLTVFVALLSCCCRCHHRETLVPLLSLLPLLGPSLYLVLRPKTYSNSN
jgi:hypothetical protein